MAARWRHALSVVGAGLCLAPGCRSRTEATDVAPLAHAVISAPAPEAPMPPRVLSNETRALGESAAVAASLLSPWFDILDCDRVGAVAVDQIDEHFAQLFQPLDTDRSRSVSLPEYLRGSAPAQRAARSAAFAVADLDGNGSLSVSELRKHWQAVVRRLDADGNGEATRSELAAFQTTSAAPVSSDAPPRGAGVTASGR